MLCATIHLNTLINSLTGGFQAKFQANVYLLRKTSGHEINRSNKTDFRQKLNIVFKTKCAAFSSILVEVVLKRHWQ